MHVIDRLTMPMDSRHPLLLGGIRILAGLWLMFVAGALLSIHDWWGAVIFLPAALLFAVGAFVVGRRR